MPLDCHASLAMTQGVTKSQDFSTITDELLTPRIITLYCYLTEMFKNVVAEVSRSNLGGVGEDGDCRASLAMTKW